MKTALEVSKYSASSLSLWLLWTAFFCFNAFVWKYFYETDVLTTCLNVGLESGKKKTIVSHLVTFIYLLAENSYLHKYLFLFVNLSFFFNFLLYKPFPVTGKKKNNYLIYYLVQSCKSYACTNIADLLFLHTFYIITQLYRM